MSVCLSRTNGYSLTCCPTVHQVPSEADTATFSAVSDTCLLLVNSDADRLVLYDLSSSPLKSHQIDWPSGKYGNIRDLCWAKHINSFLILSEEVLCSYSPVLNELTIQLTPRLADDCFWSLTVLGCDVYVLYRCDSLYRYCIPSWTLTHSWSRADLISQQVQDQYIGHIRAHPCAGTIALLVRLKRHRQWRIDLFDRTMRKLYSGETIRMASAYPSLTLQPLGQHGQWTLSSENYTWLIQSNGRSLERHPRQQKQDVVA